MNSNNTDQDLDAKLEQLEAELNLKQVTDSEKIKTVYAEIDTDTPEEGELISKVYSWLSIVSNKYSNLSAGGKLIVGVAAIWLGFTALNLVLHLVSNLIIVGILGLVLYVAYQKIIAKTE